MGRELKRVPLDFEWPIDEVWEGYINPHTTTRHECGYCDGTGYSPTAKIIYDQWYGRAQFSPEENGSTPFSPDHPKIVAFAKRNVEYSPWHYGSEEQAVELEAKRLADYYNEQLSHHLNDDDVAALINENRLMDFTHTWSSETRWQKKDPEYMPTAKEVNEWSICGFGHDGINQYVVISAKCEKLGVGSSCEHCQGNGEVWDSQEEKQDYEEWEPTEPPTGEGYQVWETVSEGSPISPVFATPEELAQYMSVNPWGADNGSSYESWMKFITGSGFAFGMVIYDGKIKTGQEAML